MVTCLDCGARDYRESWNDGEVSLDRIPGRQSFKHNSGQKFARAPTDKVIKTTRAKALRLAGSATSTLEPK